MGTYVEQRITGECDYDEEVSADRNWTFDMIDHHTENGDHSYQLRVDVEATTIPALQEELMNMQKELINILTTLPA